MSRAVAPRITTGDIHRMIKYRSDLSDLEGLKPANDRFFSGLSPGSQPDSIRRLSELYKPAMSSDRPITRLDVVKDSSVSLTSIPLGAVYLRLANCQFPIDSLVECYSPPVDVAPLVAGSGLALFGMSKAVSAVRKVRAYRRQHEAWFQVGENSDSTSG